MRGGSRLAPVGDVRIDAERRAFPERYTVVTIVAVFLLAGLAWVMITDMLLYAFAHDPVLVARIETAKGWIFVALAGGLLYFVTSRSVARLSRARATISTVIGSIGDGVLLLGEDRKIVRANPAAQAMLGADESALVGLDAREFVRRFRVSYTDGSFVAPEELISQRVFEQPGPLHYKATLHRADGDELVILATAAAVDPRPGEPVRLVVSILHDITQIEQIERLRDELFGAAAYALKAPVAIIKGSVQLLATSDPERLERSTATIERQCGRLDRLVKNLLYFSRIRAGTLRLAPATFRLEEEARLTADEMARSSAEHELRTEIASSSSVIADREAIGMLLRNLVECAFRFSARLSPVTLVVQDALGAVDVGVRYAPNPDVLTEPVHENDELAVMQTVMRAIVKAHCGSMREESSNTAVTSWVRLTAQNGD
jgi:PAS domain S-box-containing protein